MERNLMLLIAVAVAGVLGLAIFAQMTAPREPDQNQVNLQPTFNLGSGNPSKAPDGTQIVTPTIAPGEVQIVDIKALGTGFYDKQEVRVKAGIPVKFRFSAEPNSGCGKQLVIPDYGVNLISRNGETLEATFTPQKGTHAYRCGMNMFRGVLIAE